MLFNSFDFLIFFVVVLALQAVLRHRPRNLFLLGASYLFYGWWDWRFLSLLWVSTLVEFYCGRAIARSVDPGRRRLLLGIAVAVDLGMLGSFKYFNFFVGSFAAFAGFAAEVRSRGADLIVLQGCSHPDAMAAYDPRFRAETATRLGELARSKGHTFIDGGRMPAFAAADFIDAYHLGDAGSERLTRFLVAAVNRALAPAAAGPGLP